MEYYVSIGTPAGRLTEETPFMIILGDQMLSIKASTYGIWSAFVGVRSVQQTAEALQITRQQVQKELTLLLESGLVIPADSVLECVAVRQGLGWGFDKKEQDCVINWGGAVHVPYTSYLIWCCCDGKMTLGQIVQKMRAEGVQLDDETARKAIHTLLRRNVLLLGM